MTKNYGGFHYKVSILIPLIAKIKNQNGSFSQSITLKLPHNKRKENNLLKKINLTGKSLSEALIFASTNPQYDDRVFIAHENYKLRIPAEHVVYTNCCL